MKENGFMNLRFFDAMWISVSVRNFTEEEIKLFPTVTLHGDDLYDVVCFRDKECNYNIPIMNGSILYDASHGWNNPINTSDLALFTLRKFSRDDNNS